MEDRSWGGPPNFMEVHNVKYKKYVKILLAAMMVSALCCAPALAAGNGNVADVVKETWTAAAGQIKTVVDSVVFPALDMILTIAFFGKVAMSYFDYKKHGQFEWTGPVILFACLVFTLTAPLYIWKIVGL